MRKDFGVWIDSDKAYIINDEEGKIDTVLSEIEHYHLGGGAKAKTPYGAQDASSETKLEERKKHQMKRYFQNIKNHISDANNIAIFGPGEMKIAFKNNIEQSPDFMTKLRAVETASNKLSENQMKEWVRNFYAK